LVTVKTRLNTRGLLRERNKIWAPTLVISPYCKKEEKILHLFGRCNLLRQCCQSIGISIPRRLNNEQMVTVLQICKKNGLIILPDKTGCNTNI
jgi:hypothetical protein